MKMKKLNLIIHLIILLNTIGIGQLSGVDFTEKNLEHKILTYQPTQREGVSDKDFSFGSFVLEQVKASVAKDTLRFNNADYWNVSVAFLNLGEPKEHIAMAFQRAIDGYEEGICGYFEAFGEKGDTIAKQLEELIPEVFIPFYSNCGKSKKGKDILDCKKYANVNDLDYELVKLIHKIGENDQKYRVKSPVDWSKQTPLDEDNMRLIDELHKKYGRYIGKDLVGKQLESVMWAVVQHSSIEKMEAYLPVLHQAVKSRNLHQTPFEMLLDRIHCIKYNYQFFGSQFGGDCELTDRKKRLAIKEKYGLK